MGDGGKGDKRRPSHVSGDVMTVNWERTFGTQEPKHQIRCDDYHAHTRVGIEYSRQKRCCAPNCPGCRWQRDQGLEEAL